jgi:apolipoprotein D and lipocalin family protein
MERCKLIVAGLIVGLLAANLVSNSRTIPKSVSAVESFDSRRYAGKWFEIARLENRFERNLNNTSGTYSLNEDGTIKVVNRGYNYKSGEWKEITGKARFVSSSDEAKLQVSFFGPFYSGYNVIALDPNYEYALVAGKNRQFLWLLSREKTMPEQVRNEYLRKAESLGFRTSELVWVKHDMEEQLAVAP